MSPTTESPRKRPIVHGLKALAGARAELPATTTAVLADGPIEYVKAGDGEPAVVLVGGVGMPIESWALVAPELAKTRTVLAYNGRGYGASAAPRRPQTGAVVVAELRELLGSAGIAPPYVLVGHGLGGLQVNLFARGFPHEVAGVVLLEPTHPSDDSDDRRLRFLPRALVPDGAKGKRRYDAINLMTETATEIEQAGPFPEVPLTVVSGGKTPPRLTTSREQVRRHGARQLKLVELSALGRHAVAPASGHFPQITDPDIVVRAVGEVLASWAAG